MSTVDTGRSGAADPRAPRLADPELRSRIVGYLRGAGRVGDEGFDDRWHWSPTLAEHVRVTGAGVSAAFVDHCVSRDFVRTPGPGDHDHLDDPTAPDPVRPPERYYAVAVAGADAPTDLLAQEASAGGEPGRQWWLGPGGWLAWDGFPAGARATELPAATAAGLADHLCARWYTQLRDLADDRPSTEDTGLRLARVYDRQDSSGVWFSPDRLRLTDQAQRERLAAYLSTGRIVVRVTGLGRDPLAGDDEPVLPLQFRTDGVWVWSQATAYYLLRYGVAPELGLLCHIEERASGDTAEVSDEVAVRASAVATRPTPLERPVSTSYHRTEDGDLFRSRHDPRAREQLGPELLGPDLRWRRCPAEARTGRGPVVEVPERAVAREIDRRWIGSTAALPHS